MSTDLQLAVLPVRNHAPGLTLTQGENGGFSHMGSLAIDFAYAQNNVPVYAPCDCRCVFSQQSIWATVWTSINPVKFANGQTGVISFMFVHDDFSVYPNVGDTRRKGDIISYTGVGGEATGDHTHIEVTAVPIEAGTYTMTQNSQGVWVINNPTNLWRVFSVCDNVSHTAISIINGNQYPWICILEWDDGDEWDGGNPGEPDHGGLSSYIIMKLVNVLP